MNQRPKSTMSPPLLLIAGGTGFVGSHILHQAVASGYPVRAIARHAKANSLRLMYGSKVEVYEIDDILSADFTDVLKGVWSVIHAAAPLPSQGSVEQMMKVSVDGTMGLLRQSLEAGVARFILTSSAITMINVNPACTNGVEHRWSEKDWHEITPQALDASQASPDWISYAAAKTLTEKAVWKFACEHPEIDITTINPTMCCGPFVSGYPVNDASDMSCTGLLYQYILSGKPSPLPPPFSSLAVDVRDVAQAHILALAIPDTAILAKQKRFIVSGANWTITDAIIYLTKSRPELQPRLFDASKLPEFIDIPLSTKLSAEVLGLTEYIEWEKTVEDSVDSLLNVEKNWGNPIDHIEPVTET